jgi:arylsulfatase A-like enzyme
LKIARELVLGVLGGLITGAVVGVAEAVWLLRTTGAPDMLAPLYATLLYGVLGAALGVAGGMGGAVVAFLFRRPPAAAETTQPTTGGPVRAWWEGIGWSFGASAAFTVLAGYSLYYNVKKVVYAERALDTNALAALGGTLLGFALFALLVGLLVFRSRFGRRLRFALSVGGFALIATAAAVAWAVAPTSDPRADFATGKSVPAGMEQRPNVLLIMVDTLRADYLGAYGRPNDPSPTIDALAADGLLFEHAIAGSSWTRPSGASLMTGRLPSGHGATTKGARMSDEVITCAEVQQEAGVATGALINNINLTETFNLDQGFDAFVYESPEYAFGATESVFSLTWYKVVHKLNEKFAGGHKRVEEFYQPAEVVFDDAKEFIQANKGARWSLFVHLMEPHDPYFEHPYLMGSSDEEFNGIGFARADVEHPDPAKADYLKLVYQNEITHLDRKLAEFVAWLKAEGVYDPALVILTADHGEEFNEHGGFWHGTTLYEEQIHVPLIVKLPGNTHAGTRMPYQVRQLDACVTGVVAQGLAPDPSWDGRDLLADVETFVAPPVVAEPAGEEVPDAVPEPAPPEPVVAVDPAATRAEPPDPCETRKHPLGRIALSEIDFEGNLVRSMRMNGWKVIHANEDNPRGQPVEMLFDLTVDPTETNNLHGKSDLGCGSPYGVRETEMMSEMNRALDATRASGETGGAAEMSAADTCSLCSLGYLSGSDCDACR